MIRLPFALILFLILGLGPGHAQSIMPPVWQSKHFTDHPLVGKAFLANGRAVDDSKLALALALYPFVLIGEQHDNPDHHIIQGRLLDTAVQNGRKPSVVLEMVPRSMYEAVRSYDLEKDPRLDAFAKGLKWEERGWYSWDIYRPMALAAARNGLQFAPGNLSNEVTRKIADEGYNALIPKFVQDFGLLKPLPPTAALDLNQELEASHCGMLPKEAIGKMAKVQRARDGSMAEALKTWSGPQGTVLIAGNGHIRKDRGVPWVLRQLLPGSTLQKVSETLTIRVPRANSVSIALLEVSPDKPNFEDYELEDGRGNPLYDLIIFTPAYDVSDPCIAMREHFKNKKKEN